MHIVKSLLKYGADIKEKPLICFALQNTEMVSLLIDQGAKLTPFAITKMSYGACRQGNLEILNFLLARPVTPDFDACFKALAFLSTPNQDVLRWLKGKARIRNIVVGKSTLFHIAIKNNNLDIAKMFIASGVDVNQNKCQCRKRRDPAS